MDLILILLIILLPIVASTYIKTSYAKYEKVKNYKHMTGFDAARLILDKNGLDNILILETEGTLTDHYDPTRKVVKLSRDIYRGESISSISVAAHECGHAIQDKVGYKPLRIRSVLVPITNFVSSIGYIFIMLAFIFNAFDLVYIGLGLTMFGILFQIVTLPVEFNASNRAMQELDKYNIANEEEQTGVKTVLRAAALTYVASLLASLLQLLRYILAFNRDR